MLDVDSFELVKDISDPTLKGIKGLKDLKRKRNERKYENWEELPNWGRRYWYDVVGRFGWLSRYIKEVNSDEITIRFYQEIYNEKGKLIELHEKFPEDKGHQKVLLEE